MPQESKWYFLWAAVNRRERGGRYPVSGRAGVFLLPRTYAGKVNNLLIFLPLFGKTSIMAYHFCLVWMQISFIFPTYRLAIPVSCVRGTDLKCTVVCIFLFGRYRTCHLHSVPDERHFWLCGQGMRPWWHILFSPITFSDLTEIKRLHFIHTHGGSHEMESIW